MANQPPVRRSTRKINRRLQAYDQSNRRNRSSLNRQNLKGVNSECDTNTIEDDDLDLSMSNNEKTDNDSDISMGNTISQETADDIPPHPPIDANKPDIRTMDIRDRVRYVAGAAHRAGFESLADVFLIQLCNFTHFEQTVLPLSDLLCANLSLKHLESYFEKTKR